MNVYGQTKQLVRDDKTDIIIRDHIRQHRILDYIGFAGPDFGKHNGFTEIVLSKQFKDGKVVLLEKNRQIYNKIVRRCKRFKNISIENRILRHHLKDFLLSKVLHDRRITAIDLDYCGPVSKAIQNDLIWLLTGQLVANNGLLFITLCEQERFKGRPKALASRFKDALEFMQFIAKHTGVKLELIYMKLYDNKDINRFAIPMRVCGYKVTYENSSRTIPTRK